VVAATPGSRAGVTAVRSLITGLTGQDGSYLAELLLEQGHDVVGLVRPGRAAAGLDVEIVEADIGSVEGFTAAVRAARPDRLFHLAAPTFVPDSWADAAGTVRDIAGSTGTVLTLARDLELRVLTVASPEIFGDAGVSPQTEQSPRRPGSPYGVAKLASHELVRVMREGDGLHASSAITYNHESPRRPERFVTRKITRTAAAIKLGMQDELVLGDLNAKRDWSHASDVVRGLALMLDRDEPDDYILASGVARTVGAVAPRFMPPEQRWLLDHYIRYLKEEGLSDPDALTAASALSLMEYNRAWDAAAGVCQYADQHVQDYWGARGSHKQTTGKTRPPAHGPGYYANFDPHRKEHTAAPTWRGAWFEWGLRDTSSIQGLDETRGAWVFMAGATLVTKDDPTKAEGNEHWLAARTAEGFQRFWVDYYRFAMLRYPDELLNETTLEQQGRALGAWIVDAFDHLADHPPPA
jgi:GDPmannose 4,6-dehydratase